MKHRRKHAVVRPHEAVSVRAEGQRRSRRADSRINHNQVDGAWRELMPGPAQDIGRGSDVAGMDAVSDVDQDCGGGAGEDDAFHLGDIGVSRPEIG